MGRIGLRDTFARMQAGIALLAVLTLAALPSPTVYASGGMDEAEAIMRKFKGVDDFLSLAPEQSALRTEYFNALQKYYGGPEKFSREAFDAIVAQMRSAVEKIPELKERLWETTHIGTRF